MLQRARGRVPILPALARSATTLPETGPHGHRDPQHQLNATSSSSYSLLPSPATTTRLMRAYFAHGFPHHARHAFDKMPRPDLVAWTTLISGFISSHLPSQARSSFRQMLSEGILPNAFTISSILRLRCGGGAEPVHGIAVKCGVDDQIYVANALIAAYASGGAAAGLQNAVAIFDVIVVRSEVTWTTMIAGYLRCGDGFGALEQFRKMIQDGVKTNEFSCSAAVRASAMAGSLISGKQLHSNAVKLGFSCNIAVANSLLDLYSRFRIVGEANLWFVEIPQPDLITWNTMISLMEKTDPAKSLKLFAEMELQETVNPNCFTFTSIAAASGNLGSLTSGQQLHAAAVRRGFHENLPLSNAIIDMYAKCGKITASIRVFERMSCRDIVSWTTMMMAYGSHGFAGEAMELFSGMLAAGERPDRVVLLGLIMACSHAGLVEKGLEYFTFFSGAGEGSGEEQEIYGCVVDLLGRKGRIAEAMDLVEKMPIEADERVWRALLGACRIHGDVGVGKIAARKIEEKNPGSLDACSLLCNILAGEGEWGEFARMRKMVKGKEAGKSWVEIKGRVSCFVAEDGKHPEMELVYGVLETMTEVMKMEDE